jgi:hypothetical protein
MNKNKFYEGIFALCNTISPRRKSVVLPLIIIVLGIIVPLVSMQLFSAPDFDDINSAMVLLGIALAVAGAIMLLDRVMGSGEPYDKSSGKYLSEMTIKERNDYEGAEFQGQIDFIKECFSK